MYWLSVVMYLIFLVMTMEVVRLHCRAHRLTGENTRARHATPGRAQVFKKYLEFLGRDPEYVEQLKATLEMTGGKEAFLNWIHTEEVFSKHHSYAEEPQGEIITILEGWYQDAFYQKD